jgi:hypothetical protein
MTTPVTHANPVFATAEELPDASFAGQQETPSSPRAARRTQGSRSDADRRR